MMNREISIHADSLEEAIKKAVYEVTEVEKFNIYFSDGPDKLRLKTVEISGLNSPASCRTTTYVFEVLS